MIGNYWILDEHGEPTPAADVIEWGEWHEDPTKRVLHHDFVWRSRGRRLFVSTVFLGLDHGWGEGPPVLWESMTFRFGNWRGLDQDRYKSKESALLGHIKMLERAEAIPDNSHRAAVRFWHNHRHSVRRRR